MMDVFSSKGTQKNVRSLLVLDIILRSLLRVLCRVTHDRLLPVTSSYTSAQRVLDCCPGKHIFLIFHALETYELELLRDWTTTNLHPSTTIDKVGQRFKAAWNDLLLFAIQSLFNSMGCAEYANPSFAY
ncbi:hypothetical protein TNCV_4164271 [Trichonephila clavipes]|nr:hypothetical protein TNCV_4164271 [Trichonephila clavipes]